MSPTFSSPEYRSVWLKVVGGAIAASMAVAVALALARGQIPPKLIAAAVLGASVFALAVVSGEVKAVLLGAWVLSLTYNRVYYVFEPVVGYQGGQGPYIIVSDVFLLALLGYSALGLVVRKEIPRPRGRPVWTWLLPFLLIASVGILHSRHPEWGLFEIWRYLKFGLVLLYCRYEVGKREWWACILALCLAVFFQGALSIAEIVSGKSGVLGVLGIAAPEDVPEQLREEVFLGWHRATATMSHPPQLACYFIFINPILFGLAFGTRNRRLRWSALVAGLLGLAGLGCTLSRWPNTLMVMELVLLLAGLVAMRLCTFAQALTAVLVWFLVAGVVVFTFRDFLFDRLTRDFNRSVEFREKDDLTGLRVARDHPFIGVGMNNYLLYLLEYDPSWQWAMQYQELSVHKLHTRPLASPHSGYLLYLAETGALGLLALFWLLARIFGAGFRAIRLTRGPWRVICFSLVIGLVGYCLQQLVDFSMLFDPLLYTLAFTAGLLNIAPDLFAAARSAAAAPRQIEVAV